MDELPIPDRDAQIVSDSLNKRFRSLLRQRGGWIGFDAFMRGALYEPALGYYSGGATRFGPAGDFVTAPELSPFFGGCLATACDAWFEQVDPTITEFGAGTGQLAAQILNGLHRLGKTPDAYQIVELSGSLRQQQRHTIDTLAPGLSERVQWLDGLPSRLNGVVIANEVLDAMPVRIFELSQGKVLEKGLISGGERSALAWQSRAADDEFVRLVNHNLARSEWGGDDVFALDYSAWPDGYISEIGQEAQAWIRTIGQCLDDGVLLALDYGFPASEFYHPQRATGTLACHYRHRVHHDPLIYPGLQDITAHIDFSAMAYSAQAVGLDVVGYTSQANFLLNTGLLDALAQIPVEQTVDYARQAQAVQKLVSESEMGELFKVIAFARGDTDPGLGFDRRDRSASLQSNV